LTACQVGPRTVLPAPHATAPVGPPGRLEPA
jgi:hypothetical protein